LAPVYKRTPFWTDHLEANIYKLVVIQKNFWRDIMTKHKVIHHKKDCIGCGACAAIAPDHWDMDEEGMARLKGATQNGEHWEKDIDTEEDRVANQEAADVCPVQVIKVEKVEG